MEDEFFKSYLKLLAARCKEYKYTNAHAYWVRRYNVVFYAYHTILKGKPYRIYWPTALRVLGQAEFTAAPEGFREWSIYKNGYYWFNESQARNNLAWAGIYFDNKNKRK